MNWAMLNVDVVLPHLRATSKKQVFQEIARQVVQHFGGDVDDLRDALLERERLGSTGIGKGVAIPHIKLDEFDRMIGVFAQLDQPIDFNAVDDQPVDLVFVLLAPERPGNNMHLRALSKISRFMRDDEVLEKLRSPVEEKSVETILDEWENTRAA